MKKNTNYYWPFIFMAIFITSCGNQSNKSNPHNNTGDKIVPEWKTGVALYSFHAHPFEVALAKADSAGAKYVEGFSFYQLGKKFNNVTMGNLSGEGLQKMKQMLDKRGLKMPSMYVEGAKDAAGWKKHFDMAQSFSMEYLVCEPPKAQWDMLDSLAGLYNIKVAIHEHSKELSAYWHPDSVLAALKGHPNLGVCADLGHWVRSGLDPAECLHKLQGHILGIHLKDVDEVNNLKANDVEVGKGVINFTDVINELKRQHYNGITYVECEHAWDNNMPDVKNALLFFKALVAKTEN